MTHLDTSGILLNFFRKFVVDVKPSVQLLPGFHFFPLEKTERRTIRWQGRDPVGSRDKFHGIDDGIWEIFSGEPPRIPSTEIIAS